MLTGAPILVLCRATSYYDSNINEFDSSNGCVLLRQQEDRTFRPIGYWTRTFSDAWNKLATSHKKQLTVVFAVWLLRPYLGLNPFIIRPNIEFLGF